MVGYQPFLNIISRCSRHCIQGARGWWGCVLKFLLSIFTRGRGTAKFPWAATCSSSDHWIVMLYKHWTAADQGQTAEKGQVFQGGKLSRGWKSLDKWIGLYSQDRVRGCATMDSTYFWHWNFSCLPFWPLCIWGGVAKCVWTEWATFPKSCRVGLGTER